jgi:hypothetical protein
MYNIAYGVLVEPEFFLLITSWNGLAFFSFIIPKSCFLFTGNPATISDI